MYNGQAPLAHTQVGGRSSRRQPAQQAQMQTQQALARTLQLQVPAHAPRSSKQSSHAMQESKQQSPPLPAASFASTLPAPLLSPLSSSPPPASTPSPFLHASFQIGSTHGRTAFQPSERVFHHSDVPERARQAVGEVARFLRSHTLSRDKPWNIESQSGVAIRGSKHCSWETALAKSEDRQYHREEAAARIGQAQARMEAIRRGEDPDADPRSIQPSAWNVSTFVEKNPTTGIRTGASAAGRQAEIAALRVPGAGQLPNHYATLLAQQSNLSKHMRASKEAAAAAAAEANSLEESWAAWARSAHVGGRPLQPQLDVAHSPDYAAIGEQVEAQYSPDVLANYLWQQEHPEEAAAAGLPPLEPAPGSAHVPSSLSARAARYAKPATTHHAHRTEVPATVESPPYSSAVPPAWYRAEARTKQLSRSMQQAPYAKFVHPGSYEWVDSAPTAGMSPALSSSSPLSPSLSPSASLTSGNNAVAESTLAGGAFSWSCCGHPLRDARGCQAFDVDPSRVRMVLARSDDASSAAAWGWGSRKVGGVAAATQQQEPRARSANSLDASHVRARSQQALAAMSASLHASPVTGSPPGAAARGGVSGTGMGLSGPGVASVLRLEHSGRYELHQASGDRMWSCCGAANKEDHGCVVKTITKEHRWQLDSA